LWQLSSYENAGKNGKDRAQASPVDEQAFLRNHLYYSDPFCTTYSYTRCNTIIQSNAQELDGAEPAHLALQSIIHSTDMDSDPPQYSLSTESINQEIPTPIPEVTADSIIVQKEEIREGPCEEASLGQKDQLHEGHHEETPLAHEDEFHEGQHEEISLTQQDELQEDQREEIPHVHSDNDSAVHYLTEDGDNRVRSCPAIKSHLEAFH
jgi:hypothetical protein